MCVCVCVSECVCMSVYASAQACMSDVCACIHACPINYS